MTGVRIQFEILAGMHARMRSVKGKISAAVFGSGAASRAVTGGPEDLTRLRWRVPWPRGKGGSI
jgi:hypothetical protein